MATTLIKHVFGNVMRVAIPLTMRIRTMTDGHETETEEDFYPNLDMPIEVRLMRDGGYTKSYTPDVVGNVITFTDDATLPIGTYQVTVLCYDQESRPCRYMVRAIIQIVSATKDAGIEAGVEFDTIDYVLDGAVFFYAKGDKGDKGDQGVSVASVEQIVTSHESLGVNVIRVTLTNGNTSDFEVRNGEKIHATVEGTTLVI